MPTPPARLSHVAAIGGLALIAALVTGCTGASEEQPSGAGTPAPTLIPLREYADQPSTLQRADPCPLLTKAAATALGGKPTATTWAPGDTLPGQKGAVSHEWGCEFGSDAATVSAWVAVPPVTSRQAHTWLTVKTPGCQPWSAAPDFGQPGGGFSCGGKSGSGERTVRLTGLYGDAWVGCEATAADVSAAQDQADRWCGAVLQAASEGD